MTDYFTSDLHFGHANIIRFTNRPFSGADEMDQALVFNINSRVQKDDNLFILGDFAMGRGVDKLTFMREKLSQFDCENVYLVVGNHDIKDINQLRKCGLKEVWTHCNIEENGHKVVLNHFPFMEWDGYYRGSYHLHGHIHKDRSYNEDMRSRGIRRYDVGVDANGYFPVSWEEIEAFFDASRTY